MKKTSDFRKKIDLKGNATVMKALMGVKNNFRKPEKDDLTGPGFRKPGKDDLTESGFRKPGKDDLTESGFKKTGKKDYEEER